MFSLPNVYQNQMATEAKILDHHGELVDMRGQWAKHFGNDKPIVLELACGKGDYALALAKDFPDKNFVAIDLKGNRLWVGATTAIREELENVAFLRTRIEVLEQIFAEGEVSEIWITFPDPFLRESKSMKRLTSERFLPKYKQLLKPGGYVHLKTDDDTLYMYTLEVLEERGTVPLYQNDNIYASPLAFPELAHKTYYERGHLERGLTIKYVRFNP